MKANRPSCIAATLAVALILALASSIPVDAAGTSKGATHTVTIDAVRFEPDSLTVKAGDTVIWMNKDPFPHTVTSQAGGFDSHEILAGKSWRYTSTKKGVFPYTCMLHPTMKATLRVE